MKISPEYVKRLIDEAHQLMQDQTIDEEAKAAVWSCLQSVQQQDEKQPPAVDR